MVLAMAKARSVLKLRLHEGGSLGAISGGDLLQRLIQHFGWCRIWWRA
jgi:hypothetical protein